MLIEILLLIVLAAVTMYEGIRVQILPRHFEDPMGPGGFLIFVSCILFVCAIVYLAVHKKDDVVKGGKKLSIFGGPASKAVIIFLFYAIAVSFVGYTISSTLFFVFTEHIFGESSWIRSIVIGLIMTISFWFVFGYLAGVALP